MKSVVLLVSLVVFGTDLVYGASKGNTTGTPAPKGPATTLPPPPPLRKLGEKCRENGTEHFCTGQGVEYMCSVNSTCLCKLGYEPDGSSGSCKVQYRQLGETCRETGSAHFWYFCGGAGVDVVCPSSNKCECKSGYEPDGKSDDCKIAAPKSACSKDADCTGAWTQCLKGNCTCLDGFKLRGKAKGVTCEPTDFKCPGGQKPLIDSKTKSVQLCIADIVTNTCPVGSYCNYWPSTMTDNHAFAGHCCPRMTRATPKAHANSTNTTSAPEPEPVSVCPVGITHKTGYCPDLRKNASSLPAASEANRCPFENGYACTTDGACCPRPCRSSYNFFNYQGDCYDRVTLDSPCKISTQCYPNADCTGGTCQCKKDSKRVDEVCTESA